MPSSLLPCLSQIGRTWLGALYRQGGHEQAVQSGRQEAGERRGNRAENNQHAQAGYRAER